MEAVSDNYSLFESLGTTETRENEGGVYPGSRERCKPMARSLVVRVFGEPAIGMKRLNLKRFFRGEITIKGNIR